MQTIQARDYDLWDSLAQMDIFDGVLDQMLGGLPHADWRRAWRKWGLLGLVFEFFATILNFNSVQLRFMRHTDWSGVDVERLLWRYNIPIWGRWFTYDELTFRVKKRQARWAEYILLRCGVPLTRSRYYPAWAAASRPAPRAWRKRFWRSGNIVDRVLQMAGL